ncbi:MAG: hypothetical protein ACFCU3_11930 [Verrucomicrobiales bacterium]
MKRFFLFTGLLIIVAVSGFWYFSGAHTGWTQTKIPYTEVDELTEIETTRYEDGFKPGIDVLVGGNAVGLVIFGLGVIIRGRK